MNIQKIFTIIMLAFFSTNLAYSIGLYDDNGDFNYYVNKSNPNLNLNISTMFEKIDVTHATLNVSYNFESRIDVNEVINLNEKKTFTFNVQDDFNYPENLTSEDETYFELFAYGQDGKKIKPKGDPTKFSVKVNFQKPYLTSYEDNQTLNFNVNNSQLNMIFDKLIAEWEIKNNGTSIEYFQNPSSFEEDYDNAITYNFEENELLEGRNDIEILYKDIYGNQNSINLTIVYRGKTLEIELITKKERSTLSYFFDENHPNLFKNTIYTSEIPTTIYIKTTKKTNCYYTDTLLNFQTNIPLSRTQMTTSDYLEHSISISSEKNFWIACQNRVFADEVKILSSELGFDDLIGLQLYEKPAIEIITAAPEQFVTYVPFKFQTSTTQKGVCSAKIENNTYLQNSSNYINHLSGPVEFDNGNYEVEYECFDVVYNLDTKVKNINIDTNSGTRIIDYTPKYTNAQISNIQITLSEDNICKYSKNEDDINQIQTLYQNMSLLSGNGLTRTLTTANLDKGENDYFIFCEKDGQIFSRKMTITYDPDGPQISNLVFMNEGVASDYVGSLDKISFKFDILTLTPVEKYSVETILSNESILDFITSNSGTITDKRIEDAKEITITAINLIGDKSTPLEKTIKFDLTPPTITFNKLGSNRQIACFDPDSGCYSVKYGLSQTILDCKTDIKYELNTTIEVNDNNYICVEAKDYAGNLATNQELIIPEFVILPPVNNISFENVTPENRNKTEIEYIDDIPIEPGQFPVDDGNNSYIVIAALALLLASLGGGGYYAYKKGYLDDQLKKFGIEREGAKQTQAFVASSQANRASGRGRSKYDRNLNKIHSFIDNTLKKGEEVFTNFDSTGKGKVKGYEDTLIKKDSKVVSKKEFDEFYSNSKNLKEEKSIEKEAEAFEKFYKDKKKPKTEEGKK